MARIVYRSRDRIWSPMHYTVLLIIASLIISAQAVADEGQEEVKDVQVTAESEISNSVEKCPESIAPNLKLFYPSVVALDGTSGEVTLKFIVTESGKVDNIRITESSGGLNERSFRKSAARTVRKREYEPREQPCEHTETILYNLGQ